MSETKKSDKCKCKCHKSYDFWRTCCDRAELDVIKHSLKFVDKATNVNTAEKIMTKEEYENLYIIGWHEVNKNIDGFGNYGIKYCKDQS